MRLIGFEFEQGVKRAPTCQAVDEGEITEDLREMSPAAADEAYTAKHQQHDYQDYADNPVDLRLKQFYIIHLIA